MSASKPTIHDVAARAGVSKSLVSLALRQSPKVSPASRAAILAAASELGYRTNAAARSLADRRSRTIGVLVLDLHNPIFAQILDGVQTEVRSHGYSVMLVTGNSDPATEQAEIDKLLEFQVEGLILISHRMSDTTVREFAREVPVAIITRQDVSDSNIATVSNDDIRGAQLAVEHLVRLGHTRIAHISGGENTVSADRERGYRIAMSHAKLDAHMCVVPGAFTDLGGYNAARTALAADPAPTALFVANDIAAVGAIAAIEESGLSVPDDVSIIGYDGMALGALRSLNLTTIAQPLTEMGQLGARALFARLENPDEPSAHTAMNPELIERGTTAVAVQ
jgi:DNA-binding LacI/PurR family transcriptional regulator